MTNFLIEIPTNLEIDEHENILIEENRIVFLNKQKEYSFFVHEKVFDYMIVFEDGYVIVDQFGGLKKI